jgi:hypothetical protein
MDNLEFQVLKWRWNKVRARYRTGLDPLGPPLVGGDTQNSNFYDSSRDPQRRHHALEGP